MDMCADTGLNIGSEELAHRRKKKLAHGMKDALTSAGFVDAQACFPSFCGFVRV